MKKTQRILIVDDHVLFRAALRALLTQDGAIEIVGESDNGRDAIRAVSRLAPDLVLMDLTMHGMNGLQATREIKRAYPHVRVLVMTLHVAEEYIHASVNAGADGYILKEATPKEFRVAIGAVIQGKTYGLPTNVVTGFLRGGMASGESSVFNLAGAS